MRGCGFAAYVLRNSYVAERGTRVLRENVSSREEHRLSPQKNGGFAADVLLNL